LQRCQREGVEIVVDVGHNPQAARELAAWLQAAPVAGRTHAVYAALGDKDVAGVVEALAPWVACWHLAGLVEHAPRGVDMDTFAGRLAATAAGEGTRHATVAQALAAALAATRAGDRILVFGSFHTAAAALENLAGP
jgi:dihydrofolate synthase/folylpolyglutamate synthase